MIDFQIDFFYLPQKGMPSGTQFPFSQTRREGPSSSKPRSHVYDATAPLLRVLSENVTVECAGDPGKLHFCAAIRKKEEIN